MDRIELGCLVELPPSFIIDRSQVVERRVPALILLSLVALSADLVVIHVCDSMMFKISGFGAQSFPGFGDVDEAKRRSSVCNAGSKGRGAVGDSGIAARTPIMPSQATVGNGPLRP